MSHQKSKKGRGTPIKVTKRGALCRGGTVIIRMEKSLHLKLANHATKSQVSINDLLLGLIYREVIAGESLLDIVNLNKSLSFRKSNAKKTSTKQK